MYTEMRSLPKFLESEPGDPVELERNALSAIRNILKEDASEGRQKAEERKAAKLAAAEAADVQALSGTPVPEKKRGAAWLQRAAPLAPPLPGQRPVPGRFDAIKARLQGIRMTKAQVTLVLLGLFVLIKPWLAFWIAFFVIVVFAGIFLIMGSDTFWTRALDFGRWYAKRYPDRAPVMRRKLDAVAVKWDRFLDIFPDGSVDGLYMPDFNQMAAAEVQHDAALDRRFADLSQNKA